MFLCASLTIDFSNITLKENIKEGERTIYKYNCNRIRYITSVSFREKRGLR